MGYTIDGRCRCCNGHGYHKKEIDCLEKVPNPIDSKLVGDATDQELLDVVKRRKEERELAKQRARAVKHALIFDYLQDEKCKGLLQALLPEHDRTSCSDLDLANADSARCIRCVILQSLKYRDFPSNVDIYLAGHIDRE